MNGTGTNIHPGLLGVYHFYSNDPEGNRVYRKDSKISVAVEQQGRKGFDPQEYNSQFISRELVYGKWKV